jgi:hypothetical protein
MQTKFKMLLTSTPLLILWGCCEGTTFTASGKGTAPCAACPAGNSTQAEKDQACKAAHGSIGVTCPRAGGGAQYTVVSLKSQGACKFSTGVAANGSNETQASVTDTFECCKP